jgi:MipA family protein
MISLKPFSTRIALLALLTAPFASHAQEAESRADGWGVGVGVSIRSTLYAGEENRTLPFPLVNYEGERFYVTGPALGYKFIDSESFTLNGFVAARFDGVDAKDFGRNALAARGIDRDLLEDRDMGADIGASAVFKTDAAGEFELDLRADATNTSDGCQASLDYRYPFQVGPVRLIPSIGVVALSDKLANYYYGTLSKEVARGVIDYRPSSAIITRAGFTAVLPTSPRWAFIASVSADAYPDEITDSPLIDPDTDIVPSVFLGVIRNF